MKPEIVVIIVRDSTDRLFVHQRRADKATFPGLFGLGAGGRLEPGEAPAAAASRELREETGLQTVLRPLFVLDYRDQHLQQRIHVFETRVLPQPIPTDVAEWQWSGWLSLSEVEDLAAQLCPDTALIYRQYVREHLGDKTAGD